MMFPPLLRKYDPLFEKYGGPIPVAFLRALSKKESSQNHLSHDGPAYGLLQVVPGVVLPGYNAAHRTAYTANDLLNAEINVAVGADLLRRIATAYSRHPDPNMKTDFSNPEFVRLLVAGWNSGYSEGGGVGKVASYLERHGQRVTHDAVFANAAAAGATQHLQNSAKKRWQREVADLYAAQPDAHAHSGGTGGFLVKVGITAAVALLAVKFLFK